MRPTYRDEFTRELGERLHELLETEGTLRAADASQDVIQAVVSQALALKRQLREGPQLQAGDWLSNRYRLLKELGSGGFATVWHAYDKKRKQHVAVKVLHGQHSDSAERLARFRRGARIMDQLSHPNIVRILEMDQGDGGYHYFVMEHVAGGTFAQGVTCGALSMEKRIEIILQVGAGLAFAHERDILHRDVTPENILLDPAGGPAKLTDFDLVRVADSTGGTRTGALGKFIYAAPEGMESANDVDVRCDVYSLGMTAVFSFHGKKLPAAPLMYNRARFIESLDCPQKIKTVLARATDPDRDQRFETMAEFRNALQAAITAPPSGKREGEAPAEPAPPARREPLLPVAGPSPLLPSEIVNSIGMKLVLIPAGKFVMGSPRSEEGRRDDEGPQHEVEITRPFYLGVYQVTQEQYERVMGVNPSHFKSVAGENTRLFPVEKVSWDEAVEFCMKLSALAEEKKSGRVYRLPSEAEWEYACRGGAFSSTPFHFGYSLSSTQANFDGRHPYGKADKGSYLGRTCKVGSYQANAFGLYDMHGNVWEWCADWYDKAYYATSPRRDPPGPSRGSLRVIRGGSWHGQAGYCAASDQNVFEPGGRRDDLGFRLLAVPSAE